MCSCALSIPGRAILPPVRKLPLLLPLVAFAALLVACSSAGHPSSSSTTAQSSSTTSTSAPSTTSSTTTSTTMPPNLSGPLQAGPPVSVPLGTSQVAAAEGPDGTVFVAAQAPTSTGPSVVWVVDGNGPAAIAEHLTQGVAALAVDATNLYVASYASSTTVTSFSRSGGAQDGQWTLPAINAANSSNADLLSMTVAGGHVLVGIPQGGNGGDLYSITPGSTTAPKLLLQNMGDAIGPDGTIYYERSDNRLVKLSPTGITTVGPFLANAPNGLGGGVQYIRLVAGGDVWVDEPAGQGLDDQYQLYDGSTLQQVATFNATSEEEVVDTADGVLVLSGPEGSATCPQSTSQSSDSCVFRISSSETLIDPLNVGLAEVLVGPSPAVISSNADYTALTVRRIT
jgi:hypothetical protein